MTRTDPGDVARPRAQLHFGGFFQGVNNTTIWSSPDSGSQISPLSFRQVAQAAERGLFDAFFLGEGLRMREVGGRTHDLDVAGRRGPPAARTCSPAAGPGGTSSSPTTRGPARTSAGAATSTMPTATGAPSRFAGHVGSGCR